MAISVVSSTVEPLAVGIDQGVDTTGFYCSLVTVKGIAGKVHHLAGTRYVAKFSWQIQHTDLMFDDGYSLALLAQIDKDSHLYQTG